MTTAHDALTAVVVEAVEAALAHLVEQSGPRAYTPAEVAERLGYSDDTVYRLIQEGHLHPVPHLRSVRIAASELEAFLRGES